MKKLKNSISIILTLGMLITCSACGGDASSTRLEGSNSVENAINEQIAKEDAAKTESEAETTEQTTVVTTEAVTEASSEASTEAATETTSEDATEAATAEPAKVEAPAGDTEAATEELLGEPDPNVDLDLTVMGSDMVYSSVYQLMYDTDEYIGKKIKIKGQYYSAYDETTGQYYHFVLIADAAACCSQGIEFVWGDGSHVYPDEYPADETEVEVVGTFETYKDYPDAPYDYARLGNSTMKILDTPQQ